MAYNELGARVGGAGQQAAAIVASEVFAGHLPVDRIGSEYERLIRGVLSIMERVQAELESGTLTVAAVPAVAQQVQQAFEVAQQVQQVFDATPVGEVVSHAATAPPAVAPPATNGVHPTYGYNTTFSGSTRPLKLAEHPELDPWLHAQCAALGITEVWDNRGKPNYVAAIAAGQPKTPPPFRSATQGVDKSLWPATD